MTFMFYLIIIFFMWWYDKEKTRKALAELKKSPFAYKDPNKK